mmetsp:Transcript_20925/g.51264  ORF Transcript_20925/g.51264 Transcript_20925/m.51264 type:complete len:227 (+) Transcript_20925:673-1353(+)
MPPKVTRECAREHVKVAQDEGYDEPERKERSELVIEPHPPGSLRSYKPSSHILRRQRVHGIGILFHCPQPPIRTGDHHHESEHAPVVPETDPALAIAIRALRQIRGDEVCVVKHQHQCWPDPECDHPPIEYTALVRVVYKELERALVVVQEGLRVAVPAISRALLTRNLGERLWLGLGRHRLSPWVGPTKTLAPRVEARRDGGRVRGSIIDGTWAPMRDINPGGTR